MNESLRQRDLSARMSQGFLHTLQDTLGHCLRHDGSMFWDVF